MTPTPVTLATVTSERRQRELTAQWMRQRRQAARKAGYFGPLTRAELAAQASR